MYCYAQLDENNICICVSQLSGEVNLKDMILLESLDYTLLGKKYSDGIWEVIPKPEPPTPEPTDVERIMQAYTDAELRDLEIQQGQEMLAQQMTDIELAVLGGNAV
ncbi:hypothetical protein [Anaerotignum sp. MB30-C6]|uniref:hypothetical protein n=1 Tax=Anaerotignum sp. MB30-C6 TaxID=3070814 RepID=UPI0027DCA763|nr:hypothetical protein [Anaerotignum sp. MB30-C6]WMI81609.1 hypothetical protein RBQ60_02400 [Anaerotignum sp. MB30-C6]